MKKEFLKRSLQYCGTVFLCLVIMIVLSELPYTKKAVAYVTKTTDYLESASLAEILPYIEKVQKDPKKEKLIIGDSVCGRLFASFEFMNDNYCVAGTNRGLGMPGQYIMAKLFLDSHPDAKEIDLVLTTNSMITGYENLFGYQYSTQPFLETDTLGCLDEETLDEMKEAYGFFTTNKVLVHLVDGSPILKKAYLNALSRYHPIFVLPEIPDVVVRHILKIKTLCDERGVDFYVVSAPIPDAEGRPELEKTISESFRKTALQTYFPDYYENVFYYPPDLFPDGIHPTASAEVLCEMIHHMADANHCMQDFSLPY